MTNKLRVSFIEFLNAIPLGWGFLRGSYKGAFEVLFDVPSACARHLARNEADVGLIPAIEYQRIPDLQIIPDISISSRKEVRSVLFASRTPIERIVNVALDRSSRTSAVLLKIVLSQFYGMRSVSYTEQKPEPRTMLRNYDAALLIGNNAIKAPLNGFRVYDLAQEWYRFTGLPFVFAFWAARDGIDLDPQKHIFYRSKEEGLEAFDQIADLYSQQLPLSSSDILSYLRDTLDYSLDERNLAGLNCFYQLASEIGEIDAVKPTQFLGG